MNSDDEWLEFMGSLVGKDVLVIFDSGDDITGTLEKISCETDYLILSANDGKKALAYLDRVIMIIEGPVKW